MWSIKEVFTDSWKTYKEHFELFLFTTICIIAIGALSEMRQPIAAIACIVAIITNIGYTKIFLKVSDGTKPDFTDLFKEYRLFWKYLGVSIISALALAGGLILLVIPGIIVMVRLSLAPTVLIDTNSGVMAAIKESWEITRGHFWKLLGFMVLAGILNIAGAMVFMIGLILTIPLSFYALILIYRKLSSSRTPVITSSPAVA